MEIGLRSYFLQDFTGTVLYFGAYRGPRARGTGFFGGGLQLPVQAGLQSR
jgi:hypothetical protein